MTYPRRINYRTILSSLLLLFSTNTAAELKPYIAVYDIYTKGFHIGEATQILEQLENTWKISLTSKATGIASLFQSKPTTDEQIFKLKQKQAIFISAKSDSGKDEANAQTTAYYDEQGNRLFKQTGNKRNIITLKKAPSTFLLLPINAANLADKQTLPITLYDEGTISHQNMTKQLDNNQHSIVDISAPQSNERLRYILKPAHLNIPYKIERYKNNKITAYLELKSLILR